MFKKLGFGTVTYYLPTFWLNVTKYCGILGHPLIVNLKVLTICKETINKSIDKSIVSLSLLPEPHLAPFFGLCWYDNVYNKNVHDFYGFISWYGKK